MIELSHPGGLSASIDLHGATVTSFRALGREILFVSPNAVRRAGKAIRGGIPVCWPWFAGHPEHPEWPAHGVARDQPWTLAGMGHEGGAHVARLALVDDDATRAVWPHAFHLELVVRLGSRLTVELLHTNVDDVPVQVGGGAGSGGWSAGPAGRGGTGRLRGTEGRPEHYSGRTDCLFPKTYRRTGGHSPRYQDYPPDAPDRGGQDFQTGPAPAGD
ncbi:MAG: hypothetical protein KC656_20815 [Myxococcales bacterium]|nr:hypothetical protein [Myxococcales bacterium]